MNARTSRRRFASGAAALGAALCMGRVWAFDSSGADAAREYVPTSSPDQIPVVLDQTARMHVERTNLGSSNSALNRVLPHMLQCDRDALTSPSGPVDLSKCKQPDWNTLDWSDATWVTARKSWDTDQSGVFSPEHALIVQAAAMLGGFDQIKLLSTPFWVRYGARDAFNVSPRTPDPATVDKSKANWRESLPVLAVGQSYLPQGFRNGPALVTRGVSLPELAQMPDWSNSVEDWAGGNETCPIAEIEGAYFGTNDTFRSCHDFKTVMGALNSTHFLPLARDVYTYYHLLALSRMGACKKLQVLQADFYDAYEYEADVGFSRYRQRDDTEARECEREAFVYEMYALHFLGDAWATGHMWHRWGNPEFNAFPDRLGQPFAGSDAPVYDPQGKFAANERSRRAVIASSVALLAGEVHGAKAILAKMLEGNVAKSLLSTTLLFDTAQGLIDDPLCGPQTVGFDAAGKCGTHLTSWTSGGATFPGVGDLFWNPPVAGGLDTNQLYAEQKRRLLGCTATSMRALYNAGPMTFGALGTATADPRDPLVDEGCWSQLATNGSMMGAIDPIFMDYNMAKYNAECAPRAVFQTAFDKIDDVLVENVLSGVPLLGPVGLPSIVSFPEPGELVPFATKVSARAKYDKVRARLAFRESAQADANGTQAATLTIATKSLTLLDVPPNVHSDPSQHPTTYADNTNSLIVSSMFWRSHAAELCEDVPLVYELRDRCVQAGPGGGDPDACTACVDVAELHMPRCALNSTAITSSKCQALGVYSGENGLPPLWFDVSARTDFGKNGSGLNNNIGCGAPPYFFAFAFCTGVADGGYALFGETSSSTGQIATGPVPDGCGPVPVPGIETRSVGVRLGTVSSLSGYPARSVPTPPVVRFDEQVTTYRAADCSYEIHTSRDAERTRAAMPFPLFPAPGDIRLDVFSRAYTELAVPSCFWSQRVSSFGGISCNGARGKLGIPSGYTDPGYYAEYEFLAPAGSGASNQCAIFESPQFATSCGTSAATCSSSGACVYSRVSGGMAAPSQPAVNPLGVLWYLALAPMGALFVFIGKGRQTLKVLWCDGTGKVLWHKRLDAGVFENPRPGRNAGAK